MSLFSFLNRGGPAPAVGIAPAAAPTPLTIRLRHIDIELAKLAGQPRTEIVRGAIDFWLDRRLTLRPGGDGGSR